MKYFQLYSYAKWIEKIVKVSEDDFAGYCYYSRVASLELILVRGCNCSGLCKTEAAVGYNTYKLGDLLYVAKGCNSVIKFSLSGFCFCRFESCPKH